MPEPAMDHAGLSFADYPAAKRFYTAALKPLGMVFGREYTKEVTGDFDVGMYGARGRQVLFVISGGGKTSPILHFAFRAENRAAVDAFYAAAMVAGGRDNGPPGIREHYHVNYYAAFVLDPEGHNIEAVTHTPETARSAARKPARRSAAKLAKKTASRKPAKKSPAKRKPAKGKKKR